MAVRTKSVGRRARPTKRAARFAFPGRRMLLRYLPKLTLVIIATLLMVRAAQVFPRWLDRVLPGRIPIAPLFTSQIDYWSHDIQRWADEYGLDPNLLATVMQIESCGHPTVGSSAGAQGLFQVMPFHFTAGENQLDPETNAQRGASFLEQCLTNWGNNDPGLALACYNGGPGTIRKPFTAWPNETQRYYIWGLGIYTDAATNQSSSATLDQWLNAGGKRLCQMADSALGI